MRNWRLLLIAAVLAFVGGMLNGSALDVHDVAGILMFLAGGFWADGWERRRA